MERDVNHSLSSRRETRDQQELAAQPLNISLDLAKVAMRFQAELLTTWANNIQMLTRAWVNQLDTFTQESEKVQQYTTQQSQR